MNGQTIVLVLLVVLWAVAQYGLAAHALLDLNRRPTVRGNNKVVWALVILGIPIAGALIYTVYGPTSFIRRGIALAAAPSSSGRSGHQSLPSGPEDQSDGYRQTDRTTTQRHETRVSRSKPRTRQYPQPAEQLPELPELADIDGEAGEPRPQPAPRRAANQLIRQAQRKIRR